MTRQPMYMSLSQRSWSPYSQRYMSSSSYPSGDPKSILKDLQDSSKYIVSFLFVKPWQCQFLKVHVSWKLFLQNSSISLQSLIFHRYAIVPKILAPFSSVRVEVQSNVCLQFFRHLLLVHILYWHSSIKQKAIRVNKFIQTDIYGYMNG